MKTLVKTANFAERAKKVMKDTKKNLPKSNLSKNLKNVQKAKGGIKGGVKASKKGGGSIVKSLMNRIGGGKKKGK